MDSKQFWKQKIVQALHDPPGKPFALRGVTGGHQRVAAEAFTAFTKKKWFFAAPPPDLAASGADRPVVNRPRGAAGKGGKPQIDIKKGDQALLTHPLTANATLRLPDYRTIRADLAVLEALEPLDVEDEDAEDGDTTRDANPATTVAAGEAATEAKLLAEQEARLEEEFAHANRLLSDKSVDWGDAGSLEVGFYYLWRSLRDDLGKGSADARFMYDRLPGESRTPDHSIWEHTRVVSALAFLEKARKKDEAQQPYLFRFSLNCIQDFINESRKGRDLWISSYLLSDLSFHAMLPVIERYGPDAIIYPDLRGNPHVDNWLYERRPELRESSFKERPTTHSALLPGNFVAIVPRGAQDASHLLPLEELGRLCEASFKQRWDQLATVVKDWLRSQVPVDPAARGQAHAAWEAIYERQHRTPPVSAMWTALHWTEPKQISEEDVENAETGHALPCQDPSRLPPVTNKTQRALDDRRRRLGMWVSNEVWSHYQDARIVFSKVNLGYIQNERGFDYALTHHQLSVRHRLRKEAQSGSAHLVEEPGEKCTLCGKRQALYSHHDDYRIGRLREEARRFWAVLNEDQSGAERLCGICAFKRFLVDADGAADEPCFNSLWSERVAASKQENHATKFPFPSSTTLAAQEYLAALVESKDPEIQGAIEDVLRAHGKIKKLTPTSFYRTLSRLEQAGRVGGRAARFLEIEPQQSIFPEALEAVVVRAEGEEEEKELKHLLGVVKALRALVAKKAADKLFPYAAPETQLAVVRVDGDNMGKLLLGDADTIKARWRDVIHPKVVRVLETGVQAELGWKALLDAPRLTGPSLHAFVSRALADFSHRVVPWVVEKEFGGRLIYAGGDDVLALVPASDALPLVQRLSELFSAAWFIDRTPDATRDLLRGRAGGDGGEPRESRARFGAPIALQEQPIRLELTGDDQVVAGLGPHCTLSAAIVYGHYKAPLSGMLRRSETLLKHVAKGDLGRGAVALSHSSRGGEKAVTAAVLGVREESADARRKALQSVSCATLQCVVDGFANGTLSSGLPYKLRELALLALPEQRERLLRGWVASEVGGDATLRGAVVALWLAGFAMHTNADETPSPAQSTRSVEGLILCRYLAGKGERE